MKDLVDLPSVNTHPNQIVLFTHFSMIHYDNRILVGDPRKPHGSLDDVSLGNYLVQLGYEMYLIGYHAIMKITPEFFRLKKIRLAHVTSNLLVLHMKYAHPVVRSLVHMGLYKYYEVDNSTTSNSTNSNTNTTNNSGSITVENDSQSLGLSHRPSPGLCVVRYHKNEHEQVSLYSTP